MEPSKQVVYEEISLTIYNDDAYQRVMNLQESEIIVDHIITDPPFAISQKSNFHTMDHPRHGVYFGDWDNSFDLYGWIGKYVNLLDNMDLLSFFVPIDL